MAYNLSPREGSCPVCGSTQAELLHSISSHFTAQYYALKELEPERNERIRGEIERLWGGESCEIVRCRDCGFIYADPFVPGDGPFYSLFYDNPTFPKWKWEYEETLRVLKQKQAEGELPAEPRVLEIGAGTGMFVRRIAGDVTPPDRIVTVEYSDAGKRQIEQSGIACLQVDVRELPEKYDGTFDVICMYQVLEHMDRLDPLFDRLYRLAAPGALLFVAVPNDRMLTYYEEQDAWLDNAPVHVSRWNRTAFEKIGARHHWRLDDHQVEPDSHIWRFLQFALYRYVHRTKRSGTVYNWAESRKNRLLRYLAQIPLISFQALRSLAALPDLMPREMGSSQMVVYTREKESAG